MTTYRIFDEQSRRRVVTALLELDYSKPWDVNIDRPKRSRSHNNLYWSWVGIIARETGNDPDAVHDFFKNKFLLPVEVEVGKEKFYHRTTTKLTTLSMKDYTDKVYAFALTELDIKLPVPGIEDAA
jgi:hypothetical protein